MTGAALLLLLSTTPAGAGVSAAEGAPRISVCPAASPEPGPGVIDPFHAPAVIATQLNADGKVLYRQGRWEEARQKYRAAEAADPEFLAPALNVACSFVRQERPAEAVAEVVRLIDRAYLPWRQEILAAADLGALKVLPEGKQMRAALDAARARWAQSLGEDLIFIARLRPALKLRESAAPAGTTDETAAASASGVAETLVLGPRQEIFAWSPRTRRYRQLTSEEGRVLAMARSADGRRLSYITAEKLLRGPGPALALRGLAVNELELATLTSLGRAVIGTDVRSVEIRPAGFGFGYRIEGAPFSGRALTYTLAESHLEPRALPPSFKTLVTLTGRGVSPASGGPILHPLPGGCPGTVREVRGADAVPALIVRGKAMPPSIRLRTSNELPVGGPYGAALAGLPIP